MRLDHPPESLRVAFDMHGVVCEVVPQRARPLWVQAAYAATAAAGMLGGVVLGGVIWFLALARGEPLWFVWLAPVVGWWAALAWLFAYDRSQQLERLQVRVGEGWLVIRHRVANLLQEADAILPEQEIERVVTETERVDLRDCVDCRVVRGPVLLVMRRDAEPVAIPMRSHDLYEIGWLAGAINQAIRDAQRSSEPVPVALLDLRAGRLASPSRSTGS